MPNKSLAYLLLATLAAPSAVLAQDSTLPAAPDAATADSTTMAGTAPDCEDEFTTLDADANGYLSEAESPRDHARASVDGVAAGSDGLDRDQFLQLCNAPAWAQDTPEAGAPFEGANSFTEEQAQERAIAWNVTDVSALTKDDQGIWRGTGMVGGKAVSVAVDYKGNVVTTPATN